ncbi:MAG: sensor domain-containing protein [Dehalococcoidia bacterium]
MGDPAGPSLRRRLFGALADWTTYASLFYLLLSFPIAIASWVALVTLLAVGGALSVTIIGVPILLVTMYGWCFYADLERLFANTLLQTGIRPLPFGHEQNYRWPWPRLKARISNPMTWRSLAFLLLVRFPMGIAGFVVVATTVLLSMSLVITPAFAAFGADNQVMGWKIDSPVEAVLAVALGIALFLPAVHLTRLAGWTAARITTYFLQSPETTTPQPWGDALDRAATAAVTWPGMLAGRLTENRRERTIQARIWAIHLALYLLVMVFLLFLNGVYNPGHWWVLWPAWGWGIGLSLHTGYLLRGHLGGHALAFAVTNIGLFIIDAEFADTTWFFWPLIAWAIALAAHAYVYFGFAPVQSEPLLMTEPAGGNAYLPPAVPTGEIAVDREMRTVRASGELVEVTPKEFDLLVLLTGQPGKPFSREELLEQIWKDDYEVTDRTVDTHMQRLRKKLGAAAESIQTVWGVGYRYQP